MRADTADSTPASGAGSNLPTTVNRRSMLSGILAAMAVPAAAAASQALQPEAQTLDTLWRQRAEIVAESHRIMAAIEAAEATLPAWTRRGPEFVKSNGTAFGEVVPYLALAEPLHIPGWGLLSRPSPKRINEAYRNERRADPEGAAVRRAERIAKFRDRERKHAAEREKAGIHRLETEFDDNCKARNAVEALITDGPVSFNTLVAVLLMELSYDVEPDSTLGSPDDKLSLALRLLRFTRGALSGAVAADVAALLDLPADASLSRLPFMAA